MASSRKSRSSSFIAQPRSTGLEDHNDCLSFLAVCQQSNVDILPISWQKVRGLTGKGGTAHVSKSPVHIEFELAHKRWSWSRFEPFNIDVGTQEMYKAFTLETWILTRPAIKNHANIINIEGVCWEFSGKRPASPVLVFEKAHFGDLSRFLFSSQGRQLSFFERFSICLQITKAVMHLHTQRVIHADIKPENVLIFKDGRKGLLPKIADFGYSTLVSTENETMHLASSEPWCAPEMHGRQFTFDNARKTDIFSLGMVCLWVLFSENILEQASNHEGIDEAYEEESEKSMSRCRFILKQLKGSGELVKYTKDLVNETSLLTEPQRVRLTKFFSLTLELNPLDRISDLVLLCSSLEIPIEDQNQSLYISQPELFKDLHPIFELSLCFRNLMLADYRLRNHIFKTAVSRYSQTKCQECLKMSAITAAICCHIGVGTAVDLDKAAFWATNAGSTQEVLRTQIERIRSGKDDRLYQNQALKQFLLEDIIEIELHSDEQTPLSFYEQVYTSELQEMESILGSSHDVVYNHKMKLARILSELGDYRRAAALFTDLVRDAESHPEYGPKHPITITMQIHLSAALMWLGSLKEAEGYARAAVRGSLWLHSSHPIRMRSLQVLSSALRLQGEWEKAERMQEKVVRNHERFFGADNSNTLQARGELSELHISQDHWTIAEEILREVYPLAVGILGHNDPDTLQYMVQYGRTLNCLGRYEEAGAILTDASARAEASLGSENYTTTVAKFWLASTHRKQGHLCKAGELLTDVLNIETNRYGEDSEKLHAAKVELALTYLASNSHSKVEEAVELLGDVTETCRSHAGNCIPLQLSYTAQYAAALAKLGEYTEAEELARMVLKKCERQLGSDSPKTVSSLETLADILISQGKLFEAEALEGRALKLRQTVLQKDDSHLFCTMRILASIWCSLGRVEEAKKLQRKAQKRCKRIFGVGHPETLSGARNLVKICITRGDFSEAETVQLRVIREQLRQPDVDSLQMVDDARRLMFIYSQQGRVEDMKAVRSRLLERTENLSGELRSQALEKASTPCNPAVASSGGI